MAKIEGRGRRKPTLGEMFCGPNLILRVDDKADPEFWLTLSFTPEEMNALIRRWFKWLAQSKQDEAFRALLAPFDPETRGESGKNGGRRSSRL